VNGAPLVTPLFVASSVPTAMGGTILDGTYFMTANHVFTGVGGTTGPTGGQVQTTHSFQSGLLNVVTWHAGMTDRLAGRLSGPGNQGTLVTTCGSSGPGGSSTMSYTVSGNQFQLIITNSCPGSVCDPGADAIFVRQ
jgi:hypothetical protein